MTNYEYEYPYIISMKPVVSKQAFWISNMSPRNVTLADLALNVKAFTTVNLLYKKHYDLDVYNRYKSTVTDMHYLVIKKEYY